MARCYCGECAKLDRMRLQGIPGAYQMRLGAVPPVPAECAARVELPAAAVIAASVDDLPLFRGSLEPTLF